MGFLAAYMFAWPQLPDVETLKDVKLQTPMRIYTREGLLIAEFGEKHRLPLAIDDIPEALNQALISTEDKRFYEHGGVDFLGMARVSFKLLATGRKSGGGSTITMQVARNFFLTFEQSFRRKIIEMNLSWKIEGALDKRHILELYWNKINFGQRAYGVGAAAQVYYGKTVDQLTLPQLAILAGIPKGPSTHNPVSNPEKAFKRRNHVIWRMFKEGFIEKSVYESAIKEPLTGKLHGAKAEVFAPYLAEMVRRHVIEEFGKDSAYNQGLQIYTTLVANEQRQARKALRAGLIAYDKRHGYRGPEQQLTTEQMIDEDAVQAVLTDIPEFGSLWPAVVMSVEEKQASVLVKTKGNNRNWQYQQVNLPWEVIRWAKKFSPTDSWTPPPKTATSVLAVGDQIRLYQEANGDWKWSQLPDANAAFVALNANDGAVRALEGGFDFDLSKFNRVTQATRQIGSNIKPFIYSAALDKGYTAATIINDSPRTILDWRGENIWRPKNDTKFRGPTRFRYALAYSINLVSVRIFETIGFKYAIDYLTRFGISREALKAVPSLALGTADLKPIELVTAYAAFANGGFKIEPYFIDHIEDSNGNYIFQAEAKTACLKCEQILETENAALSSFSGLEEDINSLSISENLQACPLYPVPEPLWAERIIEKRNVFIMRSIMNNVFTAGTATKTLRSVNSKLLRRKDVGGKTGTTNDAHDTWFSGFGGGIVATAWVGFDDPNRDLGKHEYGARASLPIWQKFMEPILSTRADQPLPQPDGIISVRIDPKTGLLAPSSQKNAIFEFFREENVPTKYASEVTDVNPFEEPFKLPKNEHNKTTDDSELPIKDDDSIF